MWVRGLKLKTVLYIVGYFLSHPMWVRGLKQFLKEGKACRRSRTLCGCVD